MLKVKVVYQRDGRYVITDPDCKEILYIMGAPNNWKTEKGARRWAEKHGLTVIE